MGRDPRSIENRQFGRRQTLWHGWVNVAGREREPCRVRNFSSAGALLEFDRAMPCAGRFRLTIEESGFEVDCSVRHRGRNGLGVYFTEPTETVDPPCARSRRGIAADIVKQYRRSAQTTA